MPKARKFLTLSILMLGCLSLRPEAEAQQGSACRQITRACLQAGYSASGARQGMGLRKDCVEPILNGAGPSRPGNRLPNIDPSVVAACRSGSAAPRFSTRQQQSASPTGPSASVGNIPNSDGLMTSDPQPLFTGVALGMHAMPDQQTPIVLQPNGTYQLYVTGVLPHQPGGVVNIFSTRDLTQPCQYSNLPSPILSPPQKKGHVGPCDANSTTADCADYVGMEAVFAQRKGGMIGFYIADQNVFASSRCTPPHGAFYGQLAVATAAPGASRWTPVGVTLRGAALPDCPKSTGPAAFNQPTVIRIGGDYYAYFALPRSGKSGFAVARAPVGPNGRPGLWSIWHGDHQWTTPTPKVGVQTVDQTDMAVTTPGYVTMPWVSYNTYLGTYLMTMITHQGFYYSKLAHGSSPPSQADLDAQQWSAPQEFRTAPGMNNWNPGSLTWENMSFVTPGEPNNQTTGKTGYMILSVVPSWAHGSVKTRSFDIASYSFGVTRAPAAPITSGYCPKPPGPPQPRPHPCPSGRPGCLQ